MFIDSCHIKDKHVDILKNINAFKLKISLLHVNINLSFVKNNFLKQKISKKCGIILYLYRCH